LLITAGRYLVLAGFWGFWRDRAHPQFSFQPIRGLDAGLFFQRPWKVTSKRQQANHGHDQLDCYGRILYLTLELPKQIVNNALDGAAFSINVLWLGHLDQLSLLLLLCGLTFCDHSEPGLINHPERI